MLKISSVINDCGMLRMFPDLRTCCYCFCFRWSVLRRRPGDCRWHSPSSSTWSRIIQKKKFIKEIISEEQISSEWRIEIDFSSIHRSWVQLESIHPLLVKINFWIEKKTENILCLSEYNVCDTDWRKSPWQPCAWLYTTKILETFKCTQVRGMKSNVLLRV